MRPASFIAVLAVLLLSGAMARAQDSLELIRGASGPALLCGEQNQLHAFSSSWPDGRPIAPNREPVAFVRDAEGVLKVSINPDNPAQMLIDRLSVVVSAYQSPANLVALEAGSDLTGVARLYAISFEREEVGSSWALASEDTQAGAVWWRCRAIEPSDLLP